jgi:hypothetical protein
MAFSSKPEEFVNQPSPRFQWVTGDGNTVGIWGLEWADLLLKALADYYPEYACEVWQPDLRADMTYTAQLQQNLVHRNFPAVIKRVFRHYKFYPELYSQGILRLAEQMDNDDSVFMLSANVRSSWLKELAENMERSRLLYYTFLEPCRLLPDKIKWQNPFRALTTSFINSQKIIQIRTMDYLFTGPA